VSGYLARLLTRAAPAGVAEAPLGGEVRPAAVDGPRADADPFEATIVDPPEWPSTARSDVAPIASPIVTTPLRAAPSEPDQERQSPLPIVPPAPLVPPPPARGRDVAPPSPAEPIEETTIAETLRPAPPAERAHPAPVSEIMARVETEPIDERLAIADRFMSGVLPAALLPPPSVRIEKTREIVLEHSEPPTLQPTSSAAPIEPATPYGSEHDAPAANSLVIGRLSVTVVPPAPVPLPRPNAQSSAASRVVVVRDSGAVAAGVPSFSRFG
jgi:hypothetical protein